MLKDFSNAPLEDMFGRRPKPELALSTRIEIQGNGGNLYVILGIENRGRGAAKSPFLSVNIDKPYKISDDGIDGNGNFGMKRLTKSSGVNEHRYGSSQDVVVHPGIVHDVTAIKVKVDLSKPQSSVFDLTIDYRIAAEGAKVMEGRTIIKGAEMYNKFELQAG
jgi:hypothetical protein